MDSDGGFERWGGDVDFNEWSRDESGVDEGPRWDPTPPPRWGARRIALVVGGAIAATLLGVGGVLAVISLADNGDDPQATDREIADAGQGAAAPGDLPGGADAPVIAPPAELEWYAVDGTLGFVERISAAGDGTFYALSTAPGRAFNWPPPRAIYHTADGEVWDFAVLADDVSGADLTVRDDVLYLIGTAPGFGGFDEAPIVVVSASDDAGLSWTQSSLPTIAVPPTGVGNVGWTEVSMHIASSSAGFVAVVQTNFWIDFWELVPAEMLGDARGVEPTADGVNIVDYAVFEQLEMECEAAGGFVETLDPDELPEPCRQLITGDAEAAVVDSLTWEELGLEGGQPVFSEVFFSADGETWEAVESPFEAGRTLASLHATSGGFVAAQWSNFGANQVFTSSDGRTWESAEGLPAFDWIVAAGTVAGQDVILGSARGTAAVVWSDGAGGWTEVDLLAQVDAPANGQSWISAGAVGPLGVVAVIGIDGNGIDANGPVLVHGTAPEDWTSIPLDPLVGGGFGYYSDWVAVGADQIIARVVESGPQQTNLQLVGIPG